MASTGEASRQRNIEGGGDERVGQSGSCGGGIHLINYGIASKNARP